MSDVPVINVFIDYCRREWIEEAKGLETKAKCWEGSGWGIRRGQVIGEKRGKVGGGLRQEVNVKNKLRAEMLSNHAEGHVEVEQGHRLR